MEALRAAFCSSFVFYLKAAGFHWNVTGSNFPQLHELFGKIYGEVYDSIDDFAEHIRAMGEPAPNSLATILEQSAVTETREIVEAPRMVAILMADNATVLAALNVAVAETTDQGLLNFLAGRIEAHAKHGWMLRATGNGR